MSSAAVVALLIMLAMANAHWSAISFFWDTLLEGDDSDALPIDQHGHMAALTNEGWPVQGYPLWGCVLHCTIHLGHYVCYVQRGPEGWSGYL